MSDWRLVLETSGRGGAVALARGDQLAAEVALDPARRHNRDLAPAVARLLDDHGVSPRDLRAVLVSIGPGSFTGLRVGLMSAKALAWATDCGLVPVPTFAAVAEELPADVAAADLVADALQGMIYAQRFGRDAGGEWRATEPLRIVAAAGWVRDRDAAVAVAGPGLAAVAGLLSPETPRLTAGATAAGVLRAGLRLSPAVGAELTALEPLYLRGSSAEEKRAGKPPAT